LLEGGPSFEPGAVLVAAFFSALLFFFQPNRGRSMASFLSLFSLVCLISQVFLVRNHLQLLPHVHRADRASPEAAVSAPSGASHGRKEIGNPPKNLTDHAENRRNSDATSKSQNERLQFLKLKSIFRNQKPGTDGLLQKAYLLLLRKSQPLNP
jgi:hypothetical protein